MSSSKVTYSKNKKSSLDIWKHFEKASDKQSAKCNHCSKVLKTTGGSTSGMHVHLRSCHPHLLTTAAIPGEDTPTTTASNDDVTPTDVIIPGPSRTMTETQPKKKRKLMTDYFKSSDSMEAVISRLTALDGISFRLFTESRDLRQLFKNSGHNLPKSANTVSKIIFDYAVDVKDGVKKAINKIKLQGHGFSVTLDEWTSVRSKRYMNINVHCKQFEGFCFKNLGLVKITGSMPATALITVLREHLAKFGISLEADVVGITTDGASVMKKMGTYFEGHHQLCLAHGVQLAVIDTIYKTSSALETYDTDFNDFTETGTDDDDLIIDDDDQFEFEIQRVRADPIIYKEAIEKVRRIVKMIKKSPLKADALRDYVVQEFHHNFELQLDCRTRWSSMADMIGSFLKIRNSVSKVLIDINSHINFTEEEIECLTEIYESLDVVKVTVLSICRRDATLYTADTALKFMLSKLDEKNSFVSSKLATNLRKRIQERRLLVAGVIHYLHDVEGFYAMPEDDTFRKPTGDDICEVIVSILQRLNHKSATTPVMPIEDPCVNLEPTPGTSSTSQLTLQEQLNKELEKCKTIKTPTGAIGPGFDLRGFVMTEKAMYDNNGERGVYLTEAYQYLSTLLPTSVESERIFSSAGYFCTKIRSSLSDGMLDTLSFLRTHFQEERLIENK